MDAEEIWRRFQKHMGYTDQEMEIFRSDPEKVRIVTQTPDFVKCRIIAEVIESHSCHAGHRVGDRFVLDANGYLVSDECPKKVCGFALGPVCTILPVLYERLIYKTDPNFERFNIVQCTDVGFGKRGWNGWGKILMKVYLEKSPVRERKNS